MAAGRTWVYLKTDTLSRLREVEIAGYGVLPKASFTDAGNSYKVAFIPGVEITGPLTFTVRYDKL